MIRQVSRRCWIVRSVQAQNAGDSSLPGNLMWRSDCSSDSLHLTSFMMTGGKLWLPLPGRKGFRCWACGWSPNGKQVLSAALPAFALVLLTYCSCESPRWLIIQKSGVSTSRLFRRWTCSRKYPQAYSTLLGLRKQRELAAKELVTIYFQIQAERWLFFGKFVPEAGGTEATGKPPG